MRRRTARSPNPAADRKPPARRKLARRLVVLSIKLGVFAVVLGMISVVGIFYYYGSDASLPKIAKLRSYKPEAVSRIYDRNGIVIGELSTERRTVVPYSKIPEVLVQAVVSAEDGDFFKHRGLDYMGMVRAFVANLRAGRFVQGGSTITQQVVKTFLLSPRRTIRRKVQEVILSRRLESELKKEEILHLYLNQIYFGHGRYGVQEASRFFFGKDVDQLNVAEAALLAGLPQSPQRLSPLKHPQRAKRRQRYVLKEMARHGYISEDVRKTVGQAPIRVVRNLRPFFNAAPEINDYVRAFLTKAFGAEALKTLGRDVHTTIDIKLQVAARDALRWGLRAIDARHGYRKRLRHLKRARARRRTLKRLARRQRRIVAGRSYLALVERVDDGAQRLEVNLGRRKVTIAVDSERYNPEQHVPSRRFSPGDLIRVKAVGSETFRFDAGPQGALVVMVPRTGEVLAMVGGYRYRAGGFNRALRALRQPGSAFKPFVYAAGIDSGKFTPATIVDDSPVLYNGWEPKNFDGSYRGPIRLRVGLAHSINTVAAKVIHAVGVEKVRALASSLGITTPLGQDLSLALGSSSVKIIDLTAAYCGIANGGKRVEPRFIRRIGKENVRGVEPRQVLRPEVAFVVSSMMRSVVEEGTARRARRLRRPVAGKTGTTNQQKDAWFAGFAPQVAAVVWVGFDRPRSIGRHETGGRAALPIWVRVMRQALKGKSKRPFSQPPGVLVQRIDPKSGLLAAEGATDAIEEFFIQGTEPTERARPPDAVDPDTILMDSAIQ